MPAPFGPFGYLYYFINLTIQSSELKPRPGPGWFEFEIPDLEHLSLDFGLFMFGLRESNGLS
jgi:hypothetical protein